MRCIHCSLSIIPADGEHEPEHRDFSISAPGTGAFVFWDGELGFSQRGGGATTGSIPAPRDVDGILVPPFHRSLPGGKWPHGAPRKL